MTDPSGGDAEDRQRLEDERDFLLKSLDDLEVERASGNVEDGEYRALHDDYTARAAAVIRALRDGVDARPDREQASPARRAVVIGGTIGFALLLGLGLAAALGARLPGETSSGNTGPQVLEPGDGPTRQERLEQAVAEDPQDTASRLLLARILEADDDLAGALKLYDEVIAVDDASAEAHAQAGRILYLTAGQVDEADARALVDRSIAELDRAIELVDDFADARFFRAIVRANEFGDFAGAQADLQRYLLEKPDGSFADQARQLLADVTVAIEGPPTTGASTTTTP